MVNSRTPAMTVYINDKEITLFKGARLNDALNAYSAGSLKSVLAGELIIVDRFGNTTEPDGPVTEGQKFSLKRTHPL